MATINVWNVFLTTGGIMLIQLGFLVLKSRPRSLGGWLVYLGLTVCGTMMIVSSA